MPTVLMLCTAILSASAIGPAGVTTTPLGPEARPEAWRACWIWGPVTPNGAAGL
ncbi:MAG: hypothetical protein QG656_2202, partial [Candidatus Hydrogenedentes bacterium]|nr:hypothetical protein [Candidatus Hydrogenedentota bacterium]